jgi:5-methyltetrahydrofolate corrinoid/iron sulfur protein methyltransferase
MKTTGRGLPFIVIGENIHTTRVVLRKGKHIEVDADGRERLTFTAPDGSRRTLPVPDVFRETHDFAAGKVKHVAVAVTTAMSGLEPEAGDARAYLETLVRRQEAAGANYLDVNVDEVSVEVGVRCGAMAWVAAFVESVASIPLALDSSSADVLRAGLDATVARAGSPILNSASLEQLDVLDLAAERGCGVVLGAAGVGGMPAGADERVANARRIVTAAAKRGVPLRDMHVDPLVIPVAVDPESSASFLEAVRRLRAELGPAIHLTGGLSNVSFGMPVRRLLNDVFIDLAAAAGADGGIIDPVASDLERVFAQDRESEPYRLAADLLLGRDPYGGEYLVAYRQGRLEPAEPAAATGSGRSRL